jgi:acyl-CoA thioesterase
MTPQDIVTKMMQHDTFSQWLGVQIISVDKGTCVLQMTVLATMLNGFEITHGGISYSLADSALAFAGNSYGYKAVGIETSISHTRKCVAGDVLTATATEINKTRQLAIYNVSITNQDNKLVAIFKGTVMVSDEEWF